MMSVSLSFTYLITNETKVLLYNFFEDSTATPNQWRLVLDAVSGWAAETPAFDETRHASICIEVCCLQHNPSFRTHSYYPGWQLKFLYVAITRARNRPWIVDNSESAEPMKVYWSSKDQIEIRSSTVGVPRLAVASTPKEWSKAGRTSASGSSVSMYYIINFFHRLFFNKRYGQASVAFSRAGQNREAKICNAYLLREQARFIITTARATRIQAFVDAANAFITCAQGSPRVNERLAYYGTAGECYLEAHDPKNAGDNYQIAEQYTAAACAYREGGHFDKMVKVIIRHGDAIHSDLIERLTTTAKLHYFKVYPIR